MEVRSQSLSEQQEKSKYVQRDLEDQIAEEKGYRKFRCLDGIGHYCTTGKEYYIDRETKSVIRLIEADNGRPIWLIKRRFEEVIIKKDMNKTIPKINPQEVLELLKKGYSRYEKDDRGLGSIQKHFGLSGAAVTELFKDPNLKGRKTKYPRVIVQIIDGTRELQSQPRDGVAIAANPVVVNNTASDNQEIFK